jgi:hypothetical protein
LIRSRFSEIRPARNRPQPERTIPFVATSEQKPLTWKYTTERPGAGWQRPDFDDASWSEGPGGFGTAGTPSGVVRTNWSTREIWLRREFTLTQAPKRPVSLRIHHDEDAEVYINGVLAASLGSFTSSYDTEPMTKEAQRALRPRQNVIAVHCRQTTGGQYIDVGLVYPVK